MRQQQGDVLALRRGVTKQESHGELPASLSKDGYKSVSTQYVKAALRNLPLQGVLSFMDFAPFKEVAQTFRNEFVRCCSEKLANRLLGPADAQMSVVLPIRYLPDLFMASPVLYAYKTKEEDRPSYVPLSEQDQKQRGLFHPALQHLCDAFPNQQWRDMVQLFNRICRSMDRYDGEAIPEKLANRMEYATEICDDVFVATPYHDAAVRDLNGVRPWPPQRARNPYILGTIRRLPYVIVLGRLEEGPLFSRFPHMLADTIEFLRENTKALKPLNGMDRHLWYYGNVSSAILNIPLGTRLASSVEKIVEISDKGFLFDWLKEGYVEHM